MLEKLEILEIDQKKIKFSILVLKKPNFKYLIRIQH